MFEAIIFPSFLMDDPNNALEVYCSHFLRAGPARHLRALPLSCLQLSTPPPPQPRRRRWRRLAGGYIRGSLISPARRWSRPRGPAPPPPRPFAALRGVYTRGVCARALHWPARTVAAGWRASGGRAGRKVLDAHYWISIGFRMLHFLYC